MDTATVLLVGVILHFVGDYVTQSHHVATEKTKRMGPAVAHGLIYGAPFALLTLNPAALALIAGTHIVIDRWRLARHLVWVKNLMAPKAARRTWAECSATGYPPETPQWLAVGLMIAADNTAHVLINTLTLYWLR